jgi:NADH-quinone oxidoreductase subunit L
MGGLQKYMPVTFATMFIGTLAIAGIPPLAGFFSKDEIIFQAFLHNKFILVPAVAASLMTAFYMSRLMAMTFFGTYRGPAWETAHAPAVATAAGHGVAHPADPHAHGHADQADHEVSHGPAEPHGAHGAHDSHGADAGHGHGPWHGPHESPTAMTFPLMALAVGAIVAGFVGIPPALGGGNAIEHFLEPSFTAHELVPGAAPGVTAVEAPAAEAGRVETAAAEAEHTEGEAGASYGLQLVMMFLSVLIAVAGIALAWRFYVTRPEISEHLATRFAGAHKLLTHKYYVDELYGATVIAATWMSARGLWTVDRNVVDGAVNGAGRLTVIGSWFSGLTDKRVVDGLVNLVGAVIQEGSHVFRRLQTGLVQNYAMLMLFGIFAFVSLYLFVR